ncbi:hypothetical protein V8G54_032888 [Vigna mungo]|uniref:Glycolipid transfer protein domain-containing protein n=1 Tax=Vigna mungo TaxID=3915 RepID=A0AAQ3MMT6_VIGMU
MGCKHSTEVNQMQLSLEQAEEANVGIDQSIAEQRREEQRKSAKRMAEGSGDRTLPRIAEAFKDLASVVTDSQNAEVKVAPFSHACSLVSPLFGCLGVAFKFAEMDYVAKVHDLAAASKSIQSLQSLIDLDVRGGTVRNGGSHTRNLLRVKRGLDMVRVLFEQILVTEHQTAWLEIVTVDVIENCGCNFNLRNLDVSIAISAVMWCRDLQNLDVTITIAAVDCFYNLARKDGFCFLSMGNRRVAIEIFHLCFVWMKLGNSLKDPASKAYDQVFAPHHAWAIRKAVAAGMYVLPTKEQLLKKLNEDEASAKVHMQSYVTASAPLIQYIDKLFVSRDLGIDW